VVVAVDERRHHRLAGQIHARGALGRLALALLAHPCERLALDEECGVLDRRAAVADDEARAFEPECARSALGLCVERQGSGCDHTEQQRSSRRHDVIDPFRASR